MARTIIFKPFNRPFHRVASGICCILSIVNLAFDTRTSYLNLIYVICMVPDGEKLFRLESEMADLKNGWAHFFRSISITEVLKNESGRKLDV